MICAIMRQRKQATNKATVPKATKKFRRFSVSISLEIDVDDALLSSVLTDEWRGRFYNFLFASEVAEHLAFNLLGGHGVSQLDGFADQPDSAACIVRDSMDSDATEEI